MKIGVVHASAMALFSTLISNPIGARAAQKDAIGAAAESPAAVNPPNDLPQFALAGPQGFGIVSQDRSFSLILHWLLQTDYRDFLAEKPTPDRDTFIVRFAGLRLDAIAYKRLRPQLFINFAESRVTLLDAF